MISLSHWPALFLVIGSLVSVHAVASEMPPDRAKLIYDRNWIAFSTTASGITGDIRLTPTSITLDGRIKFELRYVSELDGAGADDLFERIPQLSLFEFVNPKFQPIKQGNALCGGPKDKTELPRYLIVGLNTPWGARHRRPGEDELLIAVFRRETLPDLSQAEGVCGTFGYFNKNRP